MTAAARFGAVFGRDPEVAWHAPGRVNLIGEHTDYNDGFVLPFALERGVVAAAAARAGGVLRVASVQRGATVVEMPLDELAPDTVQGWVSYPAGVAWALRRAGLPVGGVDLLLDGALPSGAGLSSSAAVECAVGMALDELFGLGVSREQMADLTRSAENDFLGVPCGLMDQYASLLCTPGHALFLDTRSRRTEQVPLDFAADDTVLLLVDTASPHRLVEGQYAARRRDCELAARELGVPALRDIVVDDLRRFLPRLGSVTARARVRHVVTENARVSRAVELLRQGRPGEIGELLTASHASLRDDYEVSSPEQDLAVDAALAAGALGARLTGAGFGGSVIALVAAPRTNEVRDAVETAFDRAGLPVPSGVTVRPSAGAGRIGLGGVLSGGAAGR